MSPPLLSADANHRSFLAAQRPRRLAVGETHGTFRNKDVKPRSGDIGPAVRLRVHGDLLFDVASARSCGSQSSQ